MARICLASILLSCCWSLVARAQEPAQKLVIAFDRDTAKLLPPQLVMGVLVQDHQESYETINARALAMRHATHFVYQSGPESSLAAIYRDRLQMHGIVVVDIRKQIKSRNQNAERAIAPQLVSILDVSSNSAGTARP